MSHGMLQEKSIQTFIPREAQPSDPNWNGAGFMRNVIERIELTVT